MNSFKYLFFFFFVKLNFDNNIDKKRNVKKIIFNIHVINYSIDFEYSEKYLSKIRLLIAT